MKYEVIVGNIGLVYHGDSLRDALKSYTDYKKASEDGYGRVAGEPVTLFDRGEPRWEYDPVGRREQTHHSAAFSYLARNLENKS